MRNNKIGGTFFFRYSLFVLLIAIGGFAANAIVNKERMPPLSVVLVYHIAVMYLWYFLVVVQAYLINSNHYTLHRKLGILSALLAVSILISGALTVMESYPRETQKVAVITYNFFILSLFTIFYCLAIYKRKSPDSHKRLILFTLLSVLHPALFRIERVFNLPISFILLLILMSIIVFYDIRTLKKVHKSTLFGVLLTVLFFVTSIALIFSSYWNEFLTSLLKQI